MMAQYNNDNVTVSAFVNKNKNKECECKCRHLWKSNQEINEVFCSKNCQKHEFCDVCVCNETCFKKDEITLDLSRYLINSCPNKRRAIREFFRNVFLNEVCFVIPNELLPDYYLDWTKDVDQEYLNSYILPTSIVSKAIGWKYGLGIFEFVLTRGYTIELDDVINPVVKYVCNNYSKVKCLYDLPTKKQFIINIIETATPYAKRNQLTYLSGYYVNVSQYDHYRRIYKVDKDIFDLIKCSTYNYNKCGIEIKCKNILFPKNVCVKYYNQFKHLIEPAKGKVVGRDLDNIYIIPDKERKYEWEPQSKVVTRKYYLYYFSNQTSREVKKETFNKVKGKLVVYDTALVKLVGEGSKQGFKNKVKFYPQSGFESITNFIKTIKNSIMGLLTWGTLTNKISNMTLPSHDYVCEIFSTILSIVSLVKNFDILTLSSALLNFYKLVTKEPSVNITVQTNVQAFAQFEAQSLDAYLLSGLSLFLPKQLFEIFKRINVFSNVKILDDPTMLYDLLKTVFEFFKNIFNYFPDSKFKSLIGKFFDIVENKIFYLRFVKLTEIAKRISSDAVYATKDENRNRFNNLYKETMDKMDLIEWSKRSKYINESIEEIERADRIVKSYESAARIEPSCIVLEGGPGVGKSFLLSKIQRLLKKPCFSHVVKTNTDGKDWYDTYNNETNFIMDDVGQQGASQWRTIINMVSPIRLPLDCADAPLKGRKFFCSENIIVTTNNFTNLHNVSKSDGIENIEALWRRGSVFYFGTKVKYDNSNGEVRKYLAGFLEFKHYDIDHSKFVCGFQKDVQEFIDKKKLNILPMLILTKEDKDQECMILRWTVNIINIINEVRKSQYKSAQLTDERIAHIEQGILSFEPQVNMDAIFANINRENVGPNIEEIAASNKYLASREFEIIDDYPTVSKPCVGTIKSNPFLSEYDGYKWKYDDRPLNQLTNEELMDYCKEFHNRDFEDEVNIMTWIKNIILDQFNNFIEMIQNHSYTVYTILGIIALVLIVILINYILTYKNKKEVIVPFNCQNNHPSVTFLQKYHYEIKISGPKEIYTVGLASGHNFIVPAHSLASDVVYITVYGDLKSNYILLDKVKCKVFYINREADVAVLTTTENMASPFPNMAKHFKKDLIEISKELHLITPFTALKMPTINAKFPYNIEYTFPHINFINQLNVNNSLRYEFQQSGICGSSLFDVTNGIIGMHVAGSPNKGVGVSIIWNDTVRNEIRTILENDKKFLVDLNISNKVYPNTSGIKFDYIGNINTPKKTNLSPTEFKDLLPCDKEPANLLKFGSHTVKDVAKKSMQPLEDVDEDEIAFATEAITSLIDDFDDLTDYEVIKGTKYLAGLNKDSSNGYKCLKGKDDYIDFEKGEFKEFFKEELDLLLENISMGTISLEDVMKYETLKDELRMKSKEGVPRSFRVTRLHIIVLSKKVFGRLVENIIKTNEFNQVAIGLNPYIDWDKLYKKLIRCKEKVWASDIKEWDGKMLAQVQTAINDILRSKYKGKYKDLVNFLLSDLIYSFVLMNDDLWMMNHSMPSGHYLTALYNSLVNRFYKAMWFFRYADDKKVSKFLEDIIDEVLGDDTVNGCLSNEPNLNALTMRDFFESIGLKCLNSHKQPIVEPYDNFEDITFLKRYFKYHTKIGRVMCPLEVSSIVSTLSWYDKNKEYDEVMRDKIHAYQREAYLHEDKYEDLMNMLIKACEQTNYNLCILPESYLIHLYTKEFETLKTLSYSNVKYM